MVSRIEIESALAEHRAIRTEKVLLCRPDETIRACQARLVESNSGVLLVTSEKGVLLGILTLHDLLRAQLSVAEREGAGA